MSYYFNAWKNIFNYKTRTTRKEFWMFILVDVFISLMLGMATATAYNNNGAGPLSSILSLLFLAYFIISIAPQFSLMVRRFHDVGRSGWYFLMILIPIFGKAFIIYNALVDSKPGENQYGPNPKGIGNPIQHSVESN